MRGALLRLLVAIGSLKTSLAQYRVGGTVGFTVEDHSAFYNSSKAIVAVAHGAAKSIGLAYWNDAEASAIGEDRLTRRLSSQYRVDVAYSFLTLQVDVVDRSSGNLLDLESVGGAINEELRQVDAPHVTITSFSLRHTDAAKASKICETYCRRQDQCSGMLFSCGDCTACRHSQIEFKTPSPASEGTTEGGSQDPEKGTATPIPEGGSAELDEPQEKDMSTSIVEVFILILLFICLCFTGAASLCCYLALVQLRRKGNGEGSPYMKGGAKPGLRRQRGWDHRIPEYWSSVSVGRKQELVKESDEMVRAVQALMDRTWKAKSTRDRQSDASLAQLSVVAVHRNENPAMWEKYFRCRTEIAAATRFWKPGPSQQSKTTAKTMDCTNPIVKRADMLEEANEYYLFHGSSPAAVKNICQEDFDLKKSGSNRGSLYGPGLYFAEACSKSDEYCQVDTSDPFSDKNLFGMLLCRVVCGKILYTDKAKPDVNELVAACAQGGDDGVHHSVLGDREKCRNTYREYVVYDSSQVYPEYIIVYKRRRGSVDTE